MIRTCFEKMTPIGKALTATQKESTAENATRIQEVERQVAEAVAEVRSAGIPAAEIKKKGTDDRLGKDRLSHRPGNLVPPAHPL